MRQPWPLRAVDALERLYCRAADCRHAGDHWRGLGLLAVVIVLSTALLAASSFMALCERPNPSDP